MHDMWRGISSLLGHKNRTRFHTLDLLYTKQTPCPFSKPPRPKNNLCPRDRPDWSLKDEFHTLSMKALEGVGESHSPLGVRVSDALHGDAAAILESLKLPYMGQTLKTETTTCYICAFAQRLVLFTNISFTLFSQQLRCPFIKLSQLQELEDWSTTQRQDSSSFSTQSVIHTPCGFTQRYRWVPLNPTKQYQVKI